ncbi:tRNA lysidine(34) synthetase TilS [Lewinella sp. IMCC34191]|uniref:tRNA lysidine(34) synthetase TilS n=1 Tax=Lewinella sp. IMCC34191 TaxID=2259172 RepID=UPI000E2375B3|nr:tRNA lysidine(34) synthetase TilS [Lewinella sp. IMCC34191]
MRSLSDRFRDFVREEKLFGTDDTLLLAISGGVDSVVLADLLSETDQPFALAHCNYQLRGEESDQDERLVQHLASAYNVPLHSAVVPLPRPLPEGFNLQIWARNRRYTHFKKILDEYSYPLLVTAHHLDDNLETLLHHLVRGTGLKGLRGIPLHTEFPLVRPLLFASKEDIRAHALDRGLKWREDKTNATLAYQRNRIRHKLVPVLRDLGLMDSSLRDTFDHLRSTEVFLNRALADHPAVTRRQGMVSIRLAETELSVRDLITLLRFHGEDLGFSEEQYRQMAKASGYVSLHSPTHVARITPEAITMQALQDFKLPNLRIDELPASFGFGDAVMELSVVDRPSSFDGSDRMFCRLPPLPLYLRSRAKGDRFSPYGMGGRQKKVKDFFIDLKLPPWEKDRTPVLTDEAGQIVAIIPYRIDERFAVGPNDESVLEIRYHKQSPEPQR